MSLARLFLFSKPITLSAAALALAACSSRPVTISQPEPALPDVPVLETQTPDTPEHLIEQARRDWRINQDLVSRNKTLLLAAEGYIDQQQPAKAQVLLKAIHQNPGSDGIAQQANLMIARIYQNEADAETLLPLVQSLSFQPEVRRQQLLLQSDLFARKNQWLAAANALAQGAEPSEQTVRQIWQWVNQASPSTTDLSQSDYTAIRPYLALQELLKTEGLHRNRLRRAVDQFQQVYRGHPIVEYWPQEITQLLEMSPPRLEEVAVLLPLSGRYASTGGTIKEGILAAYFEQQAKGNALRNQTRLRFIDTLDKTPQQLVEDIGETQWVIGPLLKETVDGLMKVLPTHVNLLALNRLSPLADTTPQENPLPDHNAYFALAPEDEAHQLAEHIFQHGYRTPVVVSAESATQQRMLEAFELRWQQLHNEVSNLRPLTKVTFTDSNSLRQGITAALDVAQSKQRIDQIRYMVNEELYNVPRNRRDVDAIVVFASPEQTELLNPMIEASLSPFGDKTVPVFATSRSMEYNRGKNQWRDLQNVRFLDMPWMLPDTPWPELKAQTQTLWPQRSTSMSRLFAFGVDAYQLLPYLPNLALLPQVSVNGLTGQLAMNGEREIVRTLPQAVVDNERVKLLAD
ncbi:penicillin-binding protein activator [Alteromonas aestuariivivens]|uniref:penicillin-binding protein activator n=1 Tax=Alteromonas aestuariivivens TaxID=1938339 RepID=UPI0015F26BB1|nr:penicillin-binding protein activator [Alteromonas aestuariivivens]